MLDSEKTKFLCTAALASRQRETSVLTSAPQAAHCGEECKEQQRQKGGERTKARYEHAFQNTDLELPKTHEQTTVLSAVKPDVTLLLLRLRLSW